MSTHITAAARTPWALSRGVLADARPELLLATIIEAVVCQAGRQPKEVSSVVVACDTAVGAQALNLARRAVLELGWHEIPGLTVDGQGIGDLASIGIAASAKKITVVAAIDITSLVPPGASLIRDFGRPTLREPDLKWIESLALNAELNRAQLDTAAIRLNGCDAKRNPSIVPIQLGSSKVDTDGEVFLDPVIADLKPLLGPTGLLTAAHQAQLADGAAAVLVEPELTKPKNTHRPLIDHQITAGPTHTVLKRLQSAASSVTLLADASVALHEVLGWDLLSTVHTVPGLGTAPSADGLRLLVDAFHAHPAPFRIVSRGRDGQTCTVGIGDSPTGRVTEGSFA